jgi:hypothetical protein
VLLPPRRLDAGVSRAPPRVNARATRMCKAQTSLLASTQIMIKEDHCDPGVSLRRGHACVSATRMLENFCSARAPAVHRRAAGSHPRGGPTIDLSKSSWRAPRHTPVHPSAHLYGTTHAPRGSGEVRRTARRNRLTFITLAGPPSPRHQGSPRRRDGNHSGTRRTVNRKFSDPHSHGSASLRPHGSQKPVTPPWRRIPVPRTNLRPGTAFIGSGHRTA